MASTALIIGGLAVAGGVGYLIYKSLTANNTPCDQSCKALGDPGGHAVCVTACQAAGGVLGEISQIPADLHIDGGAAYYAEKARREKVNGQLNGAPLVKNAPGSGLLSLDTAHERDVGGYIPTVDADTLRYVNGCVPLFDAPDNAKCAPGTLDMYANAISQAVGGDLAIDEQHLITEPVFTSLAQRASYENAIGDRVDRAVNKNRAMTSMAGDPTTGGPFADPDGSPRWVIRGQSVKCGSGLVPLGALYQGSNDKDQSSLSDAQAQQCTDPNSIDYTGTGFRMVEGTSANCTNGHVNPGFTWDASIGSFWNLNTPGFPPPPPGFVPDDGPCDPNYYANQLRTVQVNVSTYVAPSTPTKTAARVSDTLEL